MTRTVSRKMARNPPQSARGKHARAAVGDGRKMPPTAPGRDPWTSSEDVQLRSAADGTETLVVKTGGRTQCLAGNVHINRSVRNLSKRLANQCQCEENSSQYILYCGVMRISQNRYGLCA